MREVRASQLATIHSNLPPYAPTDQSPLTAYPRDERTGGLSSNSSPGAYRKAWWAALAVFSILLLVMLVTIYSADEDTAQNQEAAETVMCDRYAAVDGSDDAK
jgi:hypothetical protein